MKLAIGADHRGFDLKEYLKSNLEYEVEDVGAHSLNTSDDYVDFAALVAKKVVDENIKGVVICGSGIGVDIVANKIKGVRCGLACNTKQVKEAREDDNINVLALAADNTSPEEAKSLIQTFMQTVFSGEERHIRRLKKIQDLEK